MRRTAHPSWLQGGRCASRRGAGGYGGGEGVVLSRVQCERRAGRMQEENLLVPARRGVPLDFGAGVGGSQPFGPVLKHGPTRQSPVNRATGIPAPFTGLWRVGPRLNAGRSCTGAPRAKIGRHTPRERGNEEGWPASSRPYLDLSGATTIMLADAAGSVNFTVPSTASPCSATSTTISPVSWSKRQRAACP